MKRLADGVDAEGADEDAGADATVAAVDAVDFDLMRSNRAPITDFGNKDKTSRTIDGGLQGCCL